MKKDVSAGPRRRDCLAVAAGLPLLASASVRPVPALEELEANSGGRLGVALWNGRGLLASHRAGEHFAACSTFKALLAAAVLARRPTQYGLLEKRLRYGAADLRTYAPVTAKFVDGGMTVGELCAAAVQHSDNVAANLLLREIGGPPELTRFARGLGDKTFRLDRWEPELNTAIPGDARDTCTPVDMARNLHALVLEQALQTEERALLTSWLVGCLTGGARIRAGVPAGWTIGDKTGTGDYGSTHDIAVIWPARGEALVLAVYFAQNRAGAKLREDVIAEATRRVLAGRT